jgi:hypothetical protein
MRLFIFKVVCVDSHVSCFHYKKHRNFGQFYLADESYSSFNNFLKEPMKIRKPKETADFLRRPVYAFILTHVIKRNGSKY